MTDLHVVLAGAVTIERSAPADAGLGLDVVLRGLRDEGTRSSPARLE